MAFPGILIITIIFAWFSVWFLKKYGRIKYLIDKIQGPTPIPILGNIHQFRLNPDEFFEQAQGVAYMFKEQPGLRMARIWLGPLPFVLIYGAEECEPILSSNKVLLKLYQYSFLSAWIGDGLLISKPNKWRPRRKLLTPTFHYDILKDFMPVYNRHARTLCSQFDKLIGSKDFNDIFHTISLCTLDIICEASLGVNIDAQRTNTDYLNAAILARKQMMDKAGGIQKMLAKKAEESDGGIRLALLDLMLDMHSRNEIDLEGIQEEVDTFTFEGHDTTSAALNWFVHSMGHNPTVQAKLQQELDEILGPDLDRDIAYDDFAEIKIC
uniref:Cytochrome P450 n=1 Tax=Meloidogyne hapla TaxID=6305 RepID=A0A1I8BEX5_MELHA